MAIRKLRVIFHALFCAAIGQWFGVVAEANDDASPEFALFFTENLPIQLPIQSLLGGYDAHTHQRI
ncbi:MAG: hypothetical protein HC919_13195 [Oscillatoriales cyanobacterium SM2_2_1]|nr:hypothetical protein [Oscillatoriales cyanobacterium SM2_2_1]